MNKKSLIFLVIIASVFLFISACDYEAVGGRSPVKYDCRDSDGPRGYFTKTTVSYQQFGDRNFNETDYCLIKPFNASNLKVSNCAPESGSKDRCGVMEQYCASKTAIGEDFYQCPEACEFGKCVAFNEAVFNKPCSERVFMTCLTDFKCAWDTRFERCIDKPITCSQLSDKKSCSEFPTCNWLVDGGFSDAPNCKKGSGCCIDQIFEEVS